MLKKLLESEKENERKLFDCGIEFWRKDSVKKEGKSIRVTAWGLF